MEMMDSYSEGFGQIYLERSLYISIRASVFALHWSLMSSHTLSFVFSIYQDNKMRKIS